MHNNNNNNKCLELINKIKPDSEVRVLKAGFSFFDMGVVYIIVDSEILLGGRGFDRSCFRWGLWWR